MGGFHLISFQICSHFSVDRNRYDSQVNVVKMRRIVGPLKKYFLLTLVFAVVLLFYFQLKEGDSFWRKTKGTDIVTNKSPQPTIHIKPIRSSAIASAATREQSPEKNEEVYEVDEIDGSITDSPDAKSWYFKKGVKYPTPQTKEKRVLKLYQAEDPHSDRIINQLMYVPPNYDEIQEAGKLKVIYVANGLGSWNVKRGRDEFLKSKCPVDMCSITAAREKAPTADLIMYKDRIIPLGLKRNPNQLHLLYMLECPYHTPSFHTVDAINWTATYR